MAYSTDEKLDYLFGQVTCLHAFCQASLRSHPDPIGLLELFEQQMLHSEANILPSPVTEAFFSGMKAVQKEFYLPGTTPEERERNAK